MIHPIRSFRRWLRFGPPRPSLWGWIRGFRGSLFVNGKHVGFTKNFEMTLAAPEPVERQKETITMESSFTLQEVRLLMMGDEGHRINEEEKKQAIEDDQPR